MSLLYFDCFSGISGDMIIGALLDCGVSLNQLEEQIAALNLPVNLSWEKKVVGGISCSAFRVEDDGRAPLRHLHHLVEIVAQSGLSEFVTSGSLKVLQELAEAEASVHGIDLEQVHFHEIGAVDTIVDITGTFIALELMGKPVVHSSPLPWPGGYIDISHGRYPVPAPATALLLKDIPCHGSDAGMELVTPTGAALLKTICSQFGPLPACIPRQVGYGAGSKLRRDKVPNLLRVVRADSYIPSADRPDPRVAVLETEVDDLNPEVFSHLYSYFLSDQDVFDFFTSPVIMKKNRPGTLITLLAAPHAAQRLSQSLIEQTSTLGVRCRMETRLMAEREQEKLTTPWGEVRIKRWILPSGRIRFKPEYDDCQAIAAEYNLPLVDVLAAIDRWAANRT
ncbi:MAG: nickel pincer cofactor biosynthesis protein LarC [Syntrophomonadaceae bacterium]|jgi:uncharacterized protein (TIGR00299 family) protein